LKKLLKTAHLIQFYLQSPYIFTIIKDWGDYRQGISYLNNFILNIFYLKLSKSSKMFPFNQSLILYFLRFMNNPALRRYDSSNSEFII